MLICGRQSIVDVTTAEIIPAEDGPSLPVEFKVHVESFGFTASRLIRIEQRDARTFVSHLRAIERVGQAAVTLASTPPDDFQLRIGFIDGPGRAAVSGRLTAATEAGLQAPALEFTFEFDPGTLPTIVAEAERWITPARSGERDERAVAFERQFLAWLHIRFGVLPQPRTGTNAEWWTFEYDGTLVSFVIVGQMKNGSRPPSPGLDWLLRVEEPEPCPFIGRVERHFEPGSAVRRRFPGGRIRAQFKSSALRQPFVDQVDGT
jgi:hypothetical protein